uniref:Lung-like 7 transmembrane receptor n=1 Tax=Philodina roseola TaxID=96448 RepID=B2L3J2_PHIRO|nr:lung-like 7 transmembrane receptor [Philodina roseola]
MLSFILVILYLISFVDGRIHNINDDGRQQILLSTFGFLRGGSMFLNVTDFTFDKAGGGKDSTFGFSIDKARNSRIGGYAVGDQADENFMINTNFQETQGRRSCGLSRTEQDADIPYVYFRIDHQAEKPKINIERSVQDFQLIEIQFDQISASIQNQTLVTSTSKTLNANTTVAPSPLITEIPIERIDGASHRFRFHFRVFINRQFEEGLFNLYFHNCFNRNSTQFTQRLLNINLTAILIERNPDSYLSAGEIPLPVLYFTWAVIYFLAGCYWIFILRTSKHPVYKIHYLMLFLVYTKAISLIFHGINHHYIATKGRHEEAWAILYYITHVLRGLLLIVAILMVGTGFSFIKHVLSVRERKLFIIAIPLQMLAVVAQVFLEEKEESDVVYVTWKQIFFIVDLLCCGAIIFPIVWSIRHLEQAARTDGKALSSLGKLKIFRQFYVMIVFYIYLTRIVVYILKLTVPFRYEWIEVVFFEMTTFVFFTFTAYKFQPAINNPYSALAQDSDEEGDPEMDVPLTQNPIYEQVAKVNQKPRRFLTKLSPRDPNDLITPDEDDEDGYHHIHMSTTQV